MPATSGCAPPTATRPTTGWSPSSVATTPPTSSGSTRTSPPSTHGGQRPRARARATDDRTPTPASRPRLPAHSSTGPKDTTMNTLLIVAALLGVLGTSAAALAAGGPPITEKILGAASISHPYTIDVNEP